MGFLLFLGNVAFCPKMNAKATLEFANKNK